MERYKINSFLKRFKIRNEEYLVLTLILHDRFSCFILLITTLALWNLTVHKSGHSSIKVISTNFIITLKTNVLLIIKCYFSYCFMKQIERS